MTPTPGKLLLKWIFDPSSHDCQVPRVSLAWRFHTGDSHELARLLLATVPFINATKPLRQVHRIFPGNGSPFVVLSVHANLKKPFQDAYRYCAWRAGRIAPNWHVGLRESGVSQPLLGPIAGVGDLSKVTW